MLDNNLGDNADAFYSLLMDAHDGLEEKDSHALNARLVLLFANEIGELETLGKLIKLANEVGAESMHKVAANTKNTPRAAT